MTVTESILASPAKINLYLRILGRRADGYHELDTLFYPVTTLYDTIRIEPGHDQNMFMRCPEFPELESTSNLIYKAWKAYGDATGFQPGVFVTLNKRIPMGGGLGGGSSNGATMLRWLNENAGSARLPLDDLITLAAGLGADVPFFLLDSPARATGIGEKLVPTAPGISGKTLLLVCPDIHVNTAWAFKAWDEKNNDTGKAESLTTRHTDTKNPSSVSPRDMVNDFEPLVFAKHPTLREIKEKLLSTGAETAAMSGSGATLFGLYGNREAATAAMSAFAHENFDIFQMECP